MREKWDVAVVGGGPAGALAAAAAARAGARVVLLERTRRAPVRCGGLIGPHARRLLALTPDLVLQEITAIRIHPPAGEPVELQAENPKAYVVDRKKLDQLLLLRASEAGVEVRLGVAARGFSGEVLYTTCGKLEFSVLIGADGPRSSVAQWAGLPGPREVLVGVQARLRVRVQQGLVQVFLGSRVAPGFFGWAIPTEEHMLVGLGTTAGRAAGELLRELLRAHFPGAEVVERTAGLIPIGPSSRTHAGRVLLVGDAAGQTKPLSGGGLYFLARCAPLAGELAAQGPTALADYQPRWQREIGQEIEFGLRVRRVFLRVTDEKLGLLIEGLRDEELAEFLAQVADADQPSKLVRAALSRPELWGRFLRLLQPLGGWRRLRHLLAPP
ncbi:MAG TPA: NAD(P)/FAD-dependent oxidoreductase [Candidatus Acetothermia bacterium]|nr:NAD(P)/FAD-dependent oxidoreductase [Candidatus Acetothermia bacterium]